MNDERSWWWWWLVMGAKSTLYYNELRKYTKGTTTVLLPLQCSRRVTGHYCLFGGSKWCLTVTDKLSALGEFRKRENNKINN